MTKLKSAEMIILVEEDLSGEKKKKIWRKHITIIYNHLIIS